MYIHVNPNPNGVYVEDCVVRAIAIATDRSWDDVYLNVCLQGYIMKNMPSVNNVWGTYLKSIGFVQYPLPTNCPDCYTIRDFCDQNRYGTYILATGSHVVAVIDGNYCDAWDSGDEMPIAIWRREIK
jgi:hypothetical protein